MDVDSPSQMGRTRGMFLMFLLREPDFLLRHVRQGREYEMDVVPMDSTCGMFPFSFAL